MYKAYLVVGGESTGTRLMTKLLIEAGCFGDDGHEQRLDTQFDKFVPNVLPIVWRRSMPHRKVMVDLELEFLLPVRDAGIQESEICLVVMTRNWMCAAASAVKAGHSHNLGQARANLEQAYIEIGELLRMYKTVGFEMVSYDFLIQGRAVYIEYLLERLGLLTTRPVTNVQIYDANERYIWEIIREKTTGTKD